MGEFHKPWRRKIGVVTLATACVLTVGWVRSWLITDYFTIDVCDQRFGLISSNNWFACIRHNYQEEQHNRVPFWFAAEHTSGRDEPFDSFRENKDYSGKYMLFSYPVIALPLSLLSAWLLIIKPPKASAAKPTPETAA